MRLLSKLHWRLISLMIMFTLPSQMFAHDFVVGAFSYNKLSDNTVEVSDYDDYYSSYVSIPETVTYGSKTYSVISIADNAFISCTRIVSVTIPNTITSIGYQAFYVCKNLSKVTIPNSVTVISSRAFYGCYQLSKVNITDLSAWCRITFGDSDANPLNNAKHLYLNDAEIIDLNIPNDVTTINSHAFRNCTALKSLTIPISVTSIKSSAFYGCSSLSSVKLPDFVTSIGNYAFGKCSSITSITIPDKVTSIGSSAFEGCSSLSKVSISNLTAWSTISMGNSTANPIVYAKHLYLNDTEIVNLVIPNDVTDINSYVFYDCVGLKSVTIPSSVTSIGTNAFCGCSSLTKLSIPGSVTQIGSLAFKDCSNLTELNVADEQSPLKISDVFFANCPIEKLYLGRELSGYSPFEGITSLNEVSIGGYVTEIGESFFNKCSGITSLSIGDSITSIGNSAFANCSSLTSLKIGDAVTTIGNSAFASCSSLISLKIGDAVTTIGNSAFAYCSSLASLKIGDAVTTIGNSAFRNCGLTTLTLDNSLESIGNEAFSYCRDLTELTIPNTVTIIGKSSFYGCVGLTEVTIPHSVTSIGESAFDSCSNLNMLYFNAINCKSCGGYNKPVFPSGLSYVIFGNDVQLIPDYALRSCRKLTSLIIPASVTDIGYSAFSGCTDLSQIIDFSKSQLEGTSDYSKITDSSALKRIYCYSGRTYKSSCQMIYFEDMVAAKVEDEKICSLDISLSRISDLPEELVVSDIVVSDSNGNHVSAVNDVYHIKSHQAEVSYKVNDITFINSIESSKLPTISLSIADATQTTITVKAETTTDETCAINGTYINDQAVDKDGKVKFSGYYPDYAINFRGYISTDLGEFESKLLSAYTKSLNVDLKLLSRSPNKICVEVSWSDGDASISDYGFYTYGNPFDHSTLKVLDNLDPKTSNPVNFGIAVKYGDNNVKKFYYKEYFETTALTWGDNTPVATSMTSARLMSTTNLDASSGTGFEWKRYDAPDELSPNKVDCPVVDGIIVGSLRNLNSEVYYKYRPFYTSSTGTTYYGEWAVFFTGDANVYFEPEVRTYADIEVAQQTATIKGYVLPGSDDVTEQGVEYRRIGASNSRVSEEWVAVKSSGVLMIVNLTDLEYSSTYAVRTYAKTANGTFYGEEQQFSTPNSSSVSNILVDQQSNCDIITALRENPATSTAWLKVEGAQTERAQVYIVSMSGAIVANTQVEANGEWQPVELNIRPGIYLLLTSDGTSQSTLRLIVR